MKWSANDIEQYMQEKEYVDTAILPLIPVAWQQEMKAVVEAGEFTALLTEELERQLRGRVIQFPPFTYLKSENEEARIERLLNWQETISRNEMKHLFCLTSDAEWKKNEQRLNGSLIWLPSIPLQHMEPEHRREVVSSQMKQILEIVTNKWQNRHNYE